MTKKSKILFAILIIILIVSIGITFYKTVILNDFEVDNSNGDINIIE